MAFDESTPSALNSNGMATLSTVVSAVANVEGLDPSTVELIARNIREAGHIVTGGRGLSAAQMSVRDVANLLIAVNASSIAREAADQVVTYRELIAKEFVWENETRKTEVYGTFGEALELVIECAIERRLPPIFLSRQVDENLSRAFARRRAKIGITFEKPNAGVRLILSSNYGDPIPTNRRENAAVDQSEIPGLGRTLTSFSQQLLFHFSRPRTRGSTHSRVDRQEQITIGSRTI